MIHIILIESELTCDQCEIAKRVIDRMVEKYPGQIEVKVLDVLDPEADKYGIVMTPTVVVNNTIISTHRAPRPERLEAMIKRLLPE
jgi:predicted DsbA family dithiol-disulfide isomerase